ncbi:MAG: sulfur carrier protein ThiS adenylyltransferase ThiF [Phycisphaerales bacterium]
MRITVNGRSTEMPAAADAAAVRARVKPGADLVIVNGAVVEGGHPVRDGDEVTLIRRGEVPAADELEALMVARHTPGVHARLKRSCVGIAGLGGLGSAVAVALARVGVGRLVLVDFDVVEPSNLNRQQYFVDQLGMPKTEALAANLRRIQPYVSIEAHAVRLDAGNVAATFQSIDLLVEAFDRADQKEMLLEAFPAARPGAPFVGESGVAGHGDTASIGVRRLGGGVYVVGDRESAAEPGRGLMAPRVGVAAHVQANLAVRILLGEA